MAVPLCSTCLRNSFLGQVERVTECTRFPRLEFGGRGGKDFAVVFLFLFGILNVPNSAHFVCNHTLFILKRD